MPTDLSERQKSILDAVIREYVARAEPVASSELVRRHHLPYSPATVRNELQTLNEAGFLSQPHTSAGRVPTDQGYRFFINHLMRGHGIAGREERVLNELSELSDPTEFIKQASRLMAHLSRSVALTGFPEKDIFYKSGLGEVMREPEFSDLEMVHEFSALVDEIESEISQCFPARRPPAGRAGQAGVPGEFDGPRTFIGAENPIRRARHYGMIISSCRTPFLKESVIALVGPKRMDYEHNLALLKYFQEIMVG